jgi:hypothetical protein
VNSLARESGKKNKTKNIEELTKEADADLDSREIAINWFSQHQVVVFDLGGLSGE